MSEQGPVGLSATQAGAIWSGAPRSLTLPVGEMHLWRTSLTSTVGYENHVAALISEAERERASTFRQKPDRDRNTLARAALRDILGRYLDADPKSLQFLLTETGKPFLDPARHPDAPRFNISHSGDIVLLAFARGGDVGVDVEMIHRDIDVFDLAPRVFSAAELRQLEETPPALRVRAFFNGWTRKEAYLKARAEGIGDGLVRFSVTLTPDKATRLISDDLYPDEVASWRIEDIPLGPDYAAAIAIRGKVGRLRLWSW